MSRDFKAADTEYLGHTAAGIVADYPFTVSCWVYVGSFADYRMFVVTDRAASGTSFAEMYANITTGALVVASKSGTYQSAVTSTTMSPNKWHHCLGIWTSSTSRTAILDGGGKVNNTGNDGGAGSFDQDFIGTRSINSAHSLHMEGRIAEVGIWNVALTDGEGLTLAAGVSPIRVRSGSLPAYYPLYGISSPEKDYSKNNQDMTLSGTPTQADHAPVAPPFGFGLGWQGAFTAAAGGGGSARRRVGIGAGQAIRR